MSAIFYMPEVSEGDANAVDYSGALLNFYLPGTTTRKSTYSNNGRTVEHANPVVADSEGRWSPIYLKPEPYRVVLTLSVANGTTQKFDADPYTVLGQHHDTLPDAVTTTDATETTLFSIAIPTDKSVFVEALITARQATTGDVVTFVFRAQWRNVSGTVTLESGDPIIPYSSDGASAWDAIADADDSANTGRARGTGEASHTIIWTARYSTFILP